MTRNLSSKKAFLASQVKLLCNNFFFLIIILPVTTQFAERSMMQRIFSVSLSLSSLRICLLPIFPSFFYPSCFSFISSWSPLSAIFSDIGRSVKLFNVLAASLYPSIFPLFYLSLSSSHVFYTFILIFFPISISEFFISLFFVFYVHMHSFKAAVRVRCGVANLCV